LKTGHFYFAENRTFLFCLDIFSKKLDNHFKVRYKLIKERDPHKVVVLLLAYSAYVVRS